VLVILLAGCGAQAAAPSSVAASAGPFHSEATPASLAAGSNVHYKLVVRGPIQYLAGCAHTFTVWAEDSRGQQVWAEPQPQFDCFAIVTRSLAAGDSTSLEADWPTSPTLAAGRYTIHGLFLTVLPPGAGARVRENVPPLTIQVRD